MTSNSDVGLGQLWPYIGLLPDGTKPTPGPLLNSHCWCFVEFITEQLYSECRASILYNEYVICAIKIIATSSRAQWFMITLQLYPVCIIACVFVGTTTSKKPVVFYLRTWWRHQMEYFPRYWLFVPGIHPLQVNSLHKGPWRGALMLSLIRNWTNSWANNGSAGELRRHRGHY